MFEPVSPFDKDLPAAVRELNDTLHAEASRPIVALGENLSTPSRADLTGWPTFQRGTGVSARQVLSDIDLGRRFTLEDEDAPANREPVGYTAPLLDQWTSNAYSYREETSARGSVFLGLFGGGGKKVAAGAMYEAKRFRIEELEERKLRVEVGVAVRLLVATTSWEASVDISVPNIAAAAQLKRAGSEARIGIAIVGYSGPVGDLLPVPRDLDVSTLAVYLQAFEKIQRQVFDRHGMQFLAPITLSLENT